jgi:hypothetical protein
VDARLEGVGVLTSVDLRTKMNLEYVLTRSSEVDSNCECSIKHIPNPMKFAKIRVGEEEVILCPSGLFNLQDLLSEYVLTNGTPPGSVTKHYGKYVRDLAAKIYFN